MCALQGIAILDDVGSMQQLVLTVQSSPMEATVFAGLPTRRSSPTRCQDENATDDQSTRFAAT
jgi:hypothetical protein